MSSLDILVGLRQVTTQNLQVRMCHQFLEDKDIYPIAQHNQGKRAPEIVRGGMDFIPICSARRRRKQRKAE